MLDNEDLAQAIHLHLQSLGLWIRAQDVVDFVKHPETLVQFGLKKSISLATAHRWMKCLGYRWTTNPIGQYVDGHERKDVVDYCQKTFLPIWMSIEVRTRKWTDDQKDELIREQPANLCIVVWFHDESTFYANDCRKLRWVHKSETAVPCPKGEGASLMVSDFVSADYGWLRSPDKTKEARVFFKAGKNHKGYFTNDDILNQTTTAMDILTEFYPDEEHILSYQTQFSLSLTLFHLFLMDSDPYRTRSHQLFLECVHFQRWFSQFLSHTRTSCFILISYLQHVLCVPDYTLHCKYVGFKCEAGATSCCCRWALYSQPDFVAVESLLEAHCHARGFRVLLLPKFHCELNFIEQCWGYAKRKYQEFPPSSKEADLQTNLLTSLEMVSIQSMCR
ncbi:hypothetical protein L208DRAFT_1536349 [Tricholoma matsutake]|nr:hypothetical protein L208DRAFT_1536349 [Tricholoma matsutake 945]